jgi:hypothetical protein
VRGEVFVRSVSSQTKLSSGARTYATTMLSIEVQTR